MGEELKGPRDFKRECGKVAGPRRTAWGDGWEGAGPGGEGPAWGLGRAGVKGEMKRVGEKEVDCTGGLGPKEGYSRPGSS